MKRTIASLLTLLLLPFMAGAQKKSYAFNENGISRQVLENYLDKAITMVYLLTPDKPEGNRPYPYHADDIRMVKNTGAKFIGRAIYRWGGESMLNKPAFWDTARAIIHELHAYDPDIIFQGCLFEIVTTDVNQVSVPAWVFQAYGLPVTSRNFNYNAMLNRQGKLVDHWRKGSSVPDITEQETQLWFYFLACSYINMGCEAFHLGQVELIGMNDPGRDAWEKITGKIRDYAKAHARRHWVLLDAHVPGGGMLKDGKSLLDFNSFPLRIKEIPEKPCKGKLQVNYLDGIYNKSKGGISPSGWPCEHLPYLVEFDNFGRSDKPNVADTTSHFVWGWDEISWLSLQPEAYRNSWLQYAHNWIKRTDPNGHLEMPGSRMITCPNTSQGSYRANTRSLACPIGYSQEETIKTLFH
ncbi:hypothetical protein DCC81_20485 [Chitinophaga parva]|uniref:DUF3863 domain-containing protein n=1 Tax=Chitinophaga parva TaxID=2169414 RepID=A0A2T7BCK2_9BACT|nr:hypothetical protein [Chitinophaga parva]PUZ22805.1 hypothetical protein DCC81_20485 [Chitinophaga parva]